MQPCMQAWASALPNLGFIIGGFIIGVPAFRVLPPMKGPKMIRFQHIFNWKRHFQNSYHFGDPVSFQGPGAPRPGLLSVRPARVYYRVGFIIVRWRLVDSRPLEAT